MQQAFEFPFPLLSLTSFVLAQRACEMLEKRKSYLFAWGQEQQDLTLMSGKRKGQIWEKVIRSSSHNAEHKNIRRGKCRKPVDRMKHLTVILQTLTIKQRDWLFWQYLGQKDLGKIKAAARWLSSSIYLLMISHCQPWIELVINSALNLEISIGIGDFGWKQGYPVPCRRSPSIIPSPSGKSIPVSQGSVN